MYNFYIKVYKVCSSWAFSFCVFFCFTYFGSYAISEVLEYDKNNPLDDQVIYFFSVCIYDTTVCWFADL